jgi:hypothetical protein
MKKKKAIPKKVANKTEPTKMNNTLQEAIFPFMNPFETTQISQTDTLFKNNRWYLVSNMRQLLSEIYVEIGLVQTVVDVPVDDAYRGGVEVHSSQLDEDQLQQLMAEIDQEGDLESCCQADKWKRLFGGAGILILTDQKADTPLVMEQISADDPLEFRAVDMWELFHDKQNTEQFNAEIQDYDFEFYNYYGQKVHKSRVIKMKGIVAPSFIRPRLRGWGVSIVEILVRSINQYLKATDLSFEVLDEFKLDIFKIKNLTNTLLSAEGTALVQKRIDLANLQKNYQNAISMDSEDDYIQKQLSFSGLAETMTGIRMQVASDLRMPLTKIFGVSAAGFSSGEDDIENYNAMVEGTIRHKAKINVLKVVGLRCQKMFGFVPDDLKIEFKPLRVLSSEQEENVKTQKFSRLLQARQAGEISSKEFKEGCNRDHLLSIEVDPNIETLEPQTEDEDGDTSEPAAPKAAKSTMSAPKAKNSTDLEI